MWKSYVDFRPTFFLNSKQNIIYIMHSFTCLPFFMFYSGYKTFQEKNRDHQKIMSLFSAQVLDNVAASRGSQQ